MRLLRSGLERALRGQDDAVTGVLLALLAREHAYLEGPPGCGKSQLAIALAQAATDRRAIVGFHRDTRDSDLLGDTVLLRRPAGSGERLTHDVLPGPVQEAALLVLDDLSRAPAEALTPLLQLLGARRAAGRPVPLETAVATALSPELDARGDPLEPGLLDRFAVQIRMRGLVGAAGWGAARSLLREGAELPERPLISREERAALQDAAAALTVPEDVQGRLLELVARLAARATPEARARLSDRSFGPLALSLLRAHALLRGASEVEDRDLAAVRYMLARRLPEAAGGDFDALLQDVVDSSSESAPLPAAARAGVRAGATGGGSGARTVAAHSEIREASLSSLPAAGAFSVPADVSPLLKALAGRLERGRASEREHPGGAPRRYRRLRRLDELLDADPLEAALFADSLLPAGPRVFRRERREAGGALAVVRDVSASMEGRLSRWAGQVVAGVVRLGARRHMRLGYLEFNHDATRFTSGGQFFHRRYAQVLGLAARRRAEGRTNYEAPLRLALDEFRRRPGRERHLLLLTDGVPVLGDPLVTRERELARRLGVSIHTVFLGLGDCPPVLDLLSDETGGLRFRGTPTPPHSLHLQERGRS